MSEDESRVLVSPGGSLRLVRGRGGIASIMHIKHDSGHGSMRSVGTAVAVLACTGSLATWSPGAGASPLSTKQQLRHQNRESAIKASVLTVPQASNGYAVRIARVTYPKNWVGNTEANEGVVTVSPLVNGEPGDIAGFTTVRHGTTTNLTLHLQVQLNSGTYRVALYSGRTPPSGHQAALARTDVSITVG